MTTHRGRVSTDRMSISAPASALVSPVVPDAEKLLSHGLHPREVQDACYPLKVIKMYIDVFHGLLRQLAQFIPLRQPHLLIRDEEETINRRLLRFSLLEVTLKLLFYVLEVLLSPGKVDGCKATKAILGAQDVLSAVLPSKGMTGINVLVAIEQQELHSEPLGRRLATRPLSQAVPGLVPAVARHGLDSSRAPSTRNRRNCNGVRNRVLACG
jgi:hypothetical protein